MSELQELKKNIIYSWHARIKKSGLTQEEIAIKAGINKATLSLILRGHTIPFAKTVNKVEEVLKDQETKNLLG